MPSAAKDIAIDVNGLSREVSKSFGLSSSPGAQFQSQPSSYRSQGIARVPTGTSAKQLKPFNTEDIKILLLENVNESGRSLLKAQGYQVESLKTALAEDELIEKLRCDSMLPLRCASLLITSVQRCPRFRDSFQNQADRTCDPCGQQAASCRLFLHRHQPG